MYILLIKYKSTTPVQTFLKGFTAKQFLADMSWEGKGSKAKHTLCLDLGLIR